MLQKNFMGILDGITITLRMMQPRLVDVMEAMKIFSNNRKVSDFS